MTINDSEVLNALRQVNDPELGRNIVDLGMGRDLVVDDARVAFTLALTIERLLPVSRTTIPHLEGA